MQGNKPYRIVALTMAFLMFFTSMGFSIDMHYCKGELKNINLFGKAKSCHEGKTFCPVHGKWMDMDNSNSLDEDKNCCSNKTVQFDNLDKDYTLGDGIVLSDIQINFITAFVYSQSDLYNQPIVTKSEYLDLKPPPISRDIYVLYESFLI